MTDTAKLTKGAYEVSRCPLSEMWRVTKGGMPVDYFSSAREAREAIDRRLKYDARDAMYEALKEARVQVEMLQSRLGIKDNGSGTISIIDAALSLATGGADV